MKLRLLLLATPILSASTALPEPTSIVVGASNNNPYGVPPAAWNGGISQPNATYTLTLGGTSISLANTSNIVNLSIAIAAAIPLNGTLSEETAQVFTGTEISFFPSLTTDAPNGTLWEACFYFGSPSIPISQENLKRLTRQDICDIAWPCTPPFIGGEFPGANTTGYLSCPDAATLRSYVACGPQNLGWDIPYMLSVNQTTAPQGGTIFKFGGPPHKPGDLAAYTNSAATVWPIFSMWSIKKPGNGTLSYTPETSYGCLFASNISQGSYNFNSTAPRISGSVFSRSLLFAGSVAAFVAL